MSTATWKDQYRRVMRWKERLVSLGPCDREEDLHEVLDYAFAFFINCFHLADWLEDVVPDAKAATKAGVLDVCRGICNFAKHVTLDEKRRYSSRYYRVFLRIRGSHQGIAVSSTGYSGPAAGLGSSCRPLTDLLVVTDNSEYPLLNLADKCIQAWDEFIRDRGLGL